MNFKSIFLSFALIATCAVAVNSQTPQKVRSAHDKIHQQQLANVKHGMDKTVISNMLKEDVAKNELASNAFSVENQAMVKDLLSEARRHLGKPYRAGSKGPKSFDCSGFSSYVYKQFGYNISPSSKAQFLEGEKIERKELREGDLVFFTSRRSGSSVGHVGIVVSADNETGDFKFIHAARTGIKVDACSGYYAGRYLGARRIITD